MNAMQTITWMELEPGASEAFRIWMSGSDLAWAKDAWGRLTKLGLCSYQTERERHIIIGRFLALASIYRDWCTVAFDESQEDEPTYWVESLNVAPIVLGQLCSDDEISEDPDDALPDALHILFRHERDTVVQGLRSAYGGDSGFFVALWRSVEGFLAPEPGDEDYDEEDEYDILNDAMSNKIAAFAWITDGCQNIRP